MKEKNIQSSSSGGVGFLGLLQLLFIALKLTGYIRWRWVWVLAPTWMPLCVALVILIVGGAVAAFIKAKRKNR